MRNEGDPRARRPENQSPLETREISRFSPEARGALEREGYNIYTLTGKSIKEFEEEGRKFSYGSGLDEWFKESPDFYPKLHSLPSISSEVGINPIKPYFEVTPHVSIAGYPYYLDKSGKRRDPFLGEFPDANVGELRESPWYVNVADLVAEFSETLSEKIPGTKAIIGELPDYIELIYRHFDATGGFLFTSDTIAPDRDNFFNRHLTDVATNTKMRVLINRALETKRGKKKTIETVGKTIDVGLDVINYLGSLVVKDFIAIAPSERTTNIDIFHYHQQSFTPRRVAPLVVPRINS